ncbi:hypothetical protein [Acetobacterium wieringae]|uniref:hypothetical protein n=1 Tax=Acetobacterium wieringae TaxID=52694 RepID=UPI0026F11B9B|nr:hypothetical protein [Acetobacterium wieringae]
MVYLTYAMDCDYRYSSAKSVFGGADWVLFAKDKHADLEIYNDFDGQLTNLFRCMKFHPDEVKKEITSVLNSREFFDDFKS